MLIKARALIPRCFAQGTNFSLVNCRPQNWRPEQAVIQFGAAAAWLGRRVKKSTNRPARIGRSHCQAKPDGYYWTQHDLTIFTKLKTHDTYDPKKEEVELIVHGDAREWSDVEYMYVAEEHVRHLAIASTKFSKHRNKRSWQRLLISTKTKEPRADSQVYMVLTWAHVMPLTSD